MLGLLGVVAPAVAQAPAPDDAPEPQHVVVTGSQLPLTDMETALPVQVIRREEIERSGITSVEELVARLSANFGNANEAVGIGDLSHSGLTGVSLRGFGERSTLVLLNGRRITNYAFSDETGVGVDLNQIPVAAIDRVEILTDGASAIYGSDAIAGVVNFILRSDYKGIEAGAQQSRPQGHGGGGTDHQSTSLGIGSNAADGFNVFATIDHDREHELSARDRGFTSDYRPDLGIDSTTLAGLPANVATPTGLVNPAAPACTADSVFKLGGCYYNIHKWTDLLPEIDNLAMLARATLVSGHQGEAYAELLASRQRIRQVLAPTPINNGFYAAHGPWVIPVGSPFYPATLGIAGNIVDPFYRVIPAGPRVARTDTQAWRALAGWHGVLAGWDIDGAALQSTTHSAYVLVSGYLDVDLLPAVFDSGLVNPFGDSGPAGDAALESAVIHGPTREGRSTTQSVDFHASRTLASWSIGAVTLGLGGEARHEKMVDIPEPLAMVTTGDSYQLPKSGARDVQALYVESVLPIAPRTSAQLALRADHYSDFGTHTSPKLSLRWQPAPSLLLRASAGAGFRAPSLPELFEARGAFVGQSDVADAERCPVTQLVQDCNPTVTYLLGGNPALRPETSRQQTLGVVIAPFADSALEFNAWRIAVHQVIGQLDDETLLGHGSAYDGRYVLRGPVDPAFPTLPGPVTTLVESNLNLGGQSSSGIDIDLRTAIKTPTGKWTLHLGGSYLATWRSDAGGSALATLPRWQHTLTLDWKRDAWHATLEQNWRGGYRDENPGADGNPRRVAPYRIWSAQSGYGGGADRWSLAIGIKNLLDTKPPFSNQADYFQQGYDPGYADPRGRVWYAQATCRWH